MSKVDWLPGLRSQGRSTAGIEWYSGLISTDLEWVGHAASLLSKDEILRAERFTRPALAAAYVSTRGVLRTLLAHHLGIGERSVALRLGPRGKPFANTASPLAFNLSHTANCWLLGISYATEVGVDIEELAAGSRWQQLVPAVFHSSEVERLRACGTEMSPELFVRGWTRKEAVLKAIGVGLHEPPTAVMTNLAAEQELISLRSEDRTWWVCVEDLPVVAGQCRASVAHICPGTDRQYSRKWSLHA